MCCGVIPGPHARPRFAEGAVPVQCLQQTQTAFCLFVPRPPGGPRKGRFAGPRSNDVNGTQQGTTRQGRSTSWGSLVRAQYRPSETPASPGVFVFSGDCCGVASCGGKARKRGFRGALRVLRRPFRCLIGNEMGLSGPRSCARGSFAAPARRLTPRLWSWRGIKSDRSGGCRPRHGASRPGRA